MALRILWVIAYRDLGRNRRRTGLTMLAVMLGLAVLVMMSGFIAGIFDSMISFSILLQSGHVQIRSENLKMEKPSLKWQDLMENSEELVAAAAGTEGVTATAPVLWAGGFVNTADELIGVRVTGIEPESGFHDPIRLGMITGEYLQRDDRNGVLIGQKLAQELGLSAGSKVSLLVNTSDGETEEDVFIVRGVFATGVVSYDAGTVYLPLPKAQAITNAGDRISAVILLTEDAETADTVAVALRSTGYSVFTWEDMNVLILSALEQGNFFYIMIYGIVILIVAVLIANTLLMSVFERTRELGILAALGLKGRQITTMVLLEAGTLALIGIIGGLILGVLVVWYLSFNGLYIGDDIASMVQGFAYPSTFYAKIVPLDFLALSLAMLGIVLLAALYPARFAAKLEPVEALHAV
ncbi:MAG: ABC transporter permease [Anaerolineales bacterium]|jgi:ABC-type lipoprotein release transport system permease subunit